MCRSEALPTSQTPGLKQLLEAAVGTWRERTEPVPTHFRPEGGALRADHMGVAEMWSRPAITAALPSEATPCDHPRAHGGP